jgi:PGAP1-like protein.
MIAKGLFIDPSFDKNLVQVIITLVTPHKQPVLSLDYYTNQYYAAVNEYWGLNRSPHVDGNLSHVTLASIGGGHRDILVRSGLTMAAESDISVVVSWKSVICRFLFLADFW